MPRDPSTYTPAYRLHRPSGQAVVTLSGQDHYLGIHGTPASRQLYNIKLKEWMANGRQPADEGLSIIELIAWFYAWAQKYYRRADGTSTKSAENQRSTLSVLKRVYGDLPAREFSPLKLKAVREEMIKQKRRGRPWARSYVNRGVERIRYMFKLAAGAELVAPEIWHGLQCVTRLAPGRSDAPERAPVGPVPQAYVDVILPHVSPAIAAMIRIQALTGMRSGELVIMRTGDIDTTGKVWCYTPAHWKGSHRGKEHKRQVWIGPQAQAILRPLLKADLQAYLFSPGAGRQRLRAQRKTRVQPSQLDRSRPDADPTKKPGPHYTTNSYRTAIIRGIDRADAWAKGGMIIGNDERVIPRWHPHQLRHARGTLVRKEFGVEASMVALGHKHISTTEIYAEKNAAAAMRIAAEVG